MMSATWTEHIIYIYIYIYIYIIYFVEYIEIIIKFIFLFINIYIYIGKLECIYIATPKIKFITIITFWLWYSLYNMYKDKKCNSSQCFILTLTYIVDLILLKLLFLFQNVYWSLFSFFYPMIIYKFYEILEKWYFKWPAIIWSNNFVWSLFFISFFVFTMLLLFNICGLRNRGCVELFEKMNSTCCVELFHLINIK